jgi:predicted transcriptional regulator
VAKEMAEGDFSQVPVYKDDRLIGLLTAETIARWFANRIESEGGILDEDTVE